MENNNENKAQNIQEEKRTPTETVIGWLIILVFGLIPIFIGIGDKKKTALIVGVLFTAIGVVLLVIGRKKANIK